MNFSVCIIAKNEEKNLKETLTKLCHLLGKPEDGQYEILVMDTGSTDKTVEVALEYGGSVGHFEWIKDFSAARNAAMKSAKNDRILFLDADEIPENINLPEIIKLWKKYPDAIGRIERRNLCNNGDDGTCILTDRVERFFDRRLYHYEGVIHEQVVRNDKGKLYGYEIPFTVYHEGYYGTKEQLRKKAERNNELLFNELSKHPDDPYIYHQIAQSYDIIGDTEKSLEYYEKGYRLNPDRKAEYAALMIHAYGMLLAKSGKYDEAVNLIEKEIVNFGNYADFLCFAGYTYTKVNNLKRAIEVYKQAYNANLSHIEGSKDAIPSYNLAGIYEALSDYISAKEYYKKAASLNYKDSNQKYKEFENVDLKKRVGVVIPVDEKDKITDDFIHMIKNQSVGIGYLEIIFAITSKDEDIKKKLSLFEKEYEDSVCLAYCDQEATPEENIAGVMQYISADKIIILNSYTRIKWDSLRMMNKAIDITDADSATDNIDYSESDFLLTIEDDNMRENVRRAGIFGNKNRINMYSKSFAENNGISVNELITGEAFIKHGKKIYCIKEQLTE